MDVNLSIASDRLSDVDLQALTRDLCNTLTQAANVDARLAEEQAGGVTKGAEVILGTIVISFLTGGAAVALCTVFRAYFERDSRLEMEMEGEGGKKFKISAQNVSQRQINQTLEQVRKFLGDS